MIKNKLESLNSSKFKAFKTNGISSGDFDSSGPIGKHVGAGSAGSWSWTAGTITNPKGSNGALLGMDPDFTGVLKCDGTVIFTGEKWWR